MLFNSSSFIFVFLPLFVVAFYFAKTRAPQTIILTIGAFSVIFYWNGGAHNVLILIISIVFNYAVAVAWEKAREKRGQQLLIAFGVVANLLFLIYFKYTNFILGESFALVGRKFDALDIVLPLAISFFTFQQISFLLDLHGRKISRPRFFEYFAYVSFFPQLIAGPIVRFDEIHSQFERSAGNRGLGAIWANLSVGLSIFAFGLIKKVVLADTMAQFADPIFALAGSGNVPTTPDAWIGMTAFSFQLYFDFSGYSDMAVGLARMVGFRLPINFNSPFKSRDIGEFWRRWHMTLTRVVTDYLYTPLSLSMTRKAIMQNLSDTTVLLVGTAFPIVITFALLGLWHGAGWNFLVFGLMHAAFLIILQIWIRSRTFIKFPALPMTVGALLTFLCVSLSFVMFRADSVGTALVIYKGLFAWAGPAVPDGLAELLKLSPATLASWGIAVLPSSVWQGTTALVWLTLCATICFAAPNVYEVMRRYRPAVYKGWAPIMRVSGDDRIAPDPAPAFFVSALLLVGAAAALCVLAFFQGAGPVVQAVPTAATAVGALALLIISLCRIGRPACPVVWRRNALWLLVTASLLAIGILDVYTDQGVEFVYFEF